MLPTSRGLRLGIIFFSLVGPWFATAAVHAADIEVREFSVNIDAKPAGQYQMTINRQDDGTVQMSGRCDTQVTYVAVLKYTYSYQGTETWKDGRLRKLDSSSDDNGKRFNVQVVPDTDGLRINANGQTQTAPANSWLTTYWSLPDAKLRNHAVSLIDADTGRIIPAKLDYVGPAQLTIAGQEQNYAHYRLTGGVQVELWFDNQERLVRQEWVEDGHKAVLELARIRR
jgi:hypothetical protein